MFEVCVDGMVRVSVYLVFGLIERVLLVHSKR
jgi:hypothetical protein